MRGRSERIRTSGPCFDAEKPFNGWSKCKARFDTGLLFSDYTLHDLRRTFSSNLARLGVPIHVTEKILNHASGSIGGIAGVYNRYSYFDEITYALGRHDAHIQTQFSTAVVAIEREA
jgi:hypothetical protein